jgi:hypothetical protein
MFRFGLLALVVSMISFASGREVAFGLALNTGNSSIDTENFQGFGVSFANGKQPVLRLKFLAMLTLLGAIWVGNTLTLLESEPLLVQGVG